MLPMTQKKKRKHEKATKEVLSGKRTLDLTQARLLAPHKAYLYETTDGRRMRVFYGARRSSTSSLISIGRPLAIHHCLSWAWTVEEAEVGGQKNPYDLSKMKLH